MGVVKAKCGGMVFERAILVPYGATDEKQPCKQGCLNTIKHDTCEVLCRL
jgi:hypothetical protein